MVSRAPKTGKTAPHVPSDEDRRLVLNLSIVGRDQKYIASVIGVSKNTLRKHYRDELQHGMAKASASVAGKLYDKCMSGDTRAIMFWLRSREGWSENQGKDQDSQGTAIEFPPKIIFVGAAPDRGSADVAETTA